MKTNTFKPLSFGPTTQASTRFIRREHLAAYTPWRPGLLDPVAEASTPSEPPAPTGPSPEEIATQVQAAREQGFAQGHSAGQAEGLEQGQAALEQFKQTHAQEQATHVQRVVTALHTQFDQLQVEVADQLAQIALELARQVVRSELAQRPQLVVDVAQEALSTLLASSQAITIRVHPDDHPLVALGAQEALEARKAHLVADPDVERGGCLVESDIASIDARVATRWQRAAAALGRTSTWADTPPEAAAPPPDASDNPQESA